jgi:ubiquinone/menaquinone biosynthesis C-methylase UbiE
MNFTEYIGRQFSNPHGLVGKACCLAMNIINGKLYAKTSDAILKNSCKNVLDIGFGNGRLENMLLKHPNIVINGIDISEDMLEIATKRNKASIEDGRLSLSIGDCCNLEFPDKMFDAVTSINTIYFWSDTEKGISEIYRVLKPNGIFANAVYSQESLKKLSYTKNVFKFFSKSDYVSHGKKAGFSSVTIEEISGGKSYLIKYIK